MMKTIGKLAAVLMITALCIGQLQAQSATTTEKQDVEKKSTSTVTSGTFTDKNANGVCDNHEARVKDGKCVNKNANCGQGNKGCCGKKDSGCNAPCKGCSQGKGAGKGCGNGQGHQHRHGQGCTKPAAEPKN